MGRLNYKLMEFVEPLGRLPHYENNYGPLSINYKKFDDKKNGKV
jgi:hypothetical protein